MQEASAISRLGMNGAQMAGAALAGACVAVFGPGWALAVLRHRHAGHDPAAAGHPGAAARARAGARPERDPRAARGLVGVQVTHLAVGDGAAVHRGPRRLVRRIPGLGPAVAKAHLGGARRVGADHLGRGGRADRRRAGVAALDARPAGAVRGPDRRRDRDLAAVAGDAAAAAGDLPGRVRARDRHRDDEA